MFAPAARDQNSRMLVQARVWEVLEYSVRECAGVLRRRMPTDTVLGVLGVSLVLVLLGADAFVAHDLTRLAIVAALVGALWAVRYRGLRLAFPAAARRLEHRYGPGRRAGLVRAGELVDAGADARIERRLLPHAAEALLRAQDVAVAGEDRGQRRVDRGVQRFGRYYPLHEAPVERLPGVDALARQHEPAGAPGTDQPRQ